MSENDKQFEPLIIGFTCNWCSYPGGDTAGVARLQYPPSQRLIRTMCSGRVDPEFVMRSFELGAAVVCVSGCHYTDCHYIDANHWTEKRIAKVRRKMEKKGLRPERLQLEWISAAEGIRFAEVMTRMVPAVESLQSYVWRRHTLAVASRLLLAAEKLTMSADSLFSASSKLIRVRVLGS